MATPARQTMRVAGVPLRIAGSGVRQAGWQDIFTYPDGSVPTTSGWSDASVDYPTMFDSITVSGNKLSAMPAHLNVVDANVTLGHHLLYRDIGVSDDFEVGCTWTIDSDERLIGQIMPAIFIDEASSDPLQMGLAMTYDLSIGDGAMYIENVFRQTPIGDVHYATRTVTDLVTAGVTAIVSDNANFTTNDVGRSVTGTNIPASTTIASYVQENTVHLSQAATGSGTGGTLNIIGYYTGLSPNNLAQVGYLSFAGTNFIQQTRFGGRNTMAIRVEGGTMTMVHNGRTLAAPAVPGWAAGRTKAGIDVISAKTSVGSTSPLTGGVIGALIPELIDDWYWRPL